MKQLYICGTDTGIGKTVATGLLAKYLLDQGRSVMTQKLVQTGCPDKPEDILLHRQLMEIGWQKEDEEGHTCPYCFPFPASPHLAAQLAGEHIDPDRLNRATAFLAHYEILLIEGAGGLLVPLNQQLTLLDYIQQTGHPILLVCSARLGSINHTLLSLEAIHRREIQLAGLVYNLHQATAPEITADSAQVFRQALARYNFPQRIVELPGNGNYRQENWSLLTSIFT
jgi:dethiobiotin synthetase